MESGEKEERTGEDQVCSREGEREMDLAFAKSARAKFARVRGKCVQIYFFEFFPKEGSFFVAFCGFFEFGGFLSCSHTIFLR
jgi:hypothetical protein